MAAPTPALEPFVRQKTVLLTTYRRDGTPVGTPVHIAVEGDHASVLDKGHKPDGPVSKVGLMGESSI